MSEQVKLFWNYSNEEFQELEDDINDFLGINEIYDVKIQSYLTIDDDDIERPKYMAIIRYKEKRDK